MIKACSVTAMALVLASTGAYAASPEPQVIELQVSEGAGNNFSQGGAASGDILQLLEQLQREVQSLRGMVEKQQYQIKKMERDSRDRYRDLDRRISAAQQGTVANGTTAPAGDSTAADTAATDSAAPASSTQITDVEAYQAAFALVRQKDYGAALTAFDSFISNYPSSPRLANAYYWLGEVNLAQQNIEPAQQAFRYVMDNFAKHRKAADASYKLGVIHKQLGDAAKAKSYFEQTVAQYPGSSAANLAQDQLK